MTDHAAISARQEAYCLEHAAGPYFEKSTVHDFLNFLDQLCTLYIQNCDTLEWTDPQKRIRALLQTDLWSEEDCPGCFVTRIVERVQQPWLVGCRASAEGIYLWTLEELRWRGGDIDKITEWVERVYRDGEEPAKVAAGINGEIL
jgi:hypothetical protein